MPGVARRTDVCTGHGGFPPRSNASWSPDVFVNGLNVHRQGDSWASHNKDEIFHGGSLVSGSSSVFTNGMQIGSCYDPITCGSLVKTCSGDTFAGEYSNYFDPTEPDPSTFKPGYTEADSGNLDDEPDVDDGLNIYPTTPITTEPTFAQIERSKRIDVSPTSTIETNEDIPPEQEETPVVDCVSIPDLVPSDLQLTANFNLSKLTTDAAISNYVLKSQHSLTEKQIACNLLAWSENIGELLLIEYGPFTITSGFRHGSSTSQHERGQAADLQFPGKTNAEIYNISIWIRDNLNYDQLILEYGGNKPWIHISFNQAGNRGSSVSNKFGTRVSAGNYKWSQLINMA